MSDPDASLDKFYFEYASNSTDMAGREQAFLVQFKYEPQVMTLDLKLQTSKSISSIAVHTYTHRISDRFDLTRSKFAMKEEFQKLDHLSSFFSSLDSTAFTHTIYLSEFSSHYICNTIKEPGTQILLPIIIIIIIIISICESARNYVHIE